MFPLGGGNHEQWRPPVLLAGRNKVVETIGKTVVWVTAAASIVVRLVLVERRRRSLAAAG